MAAIIGVGVKADGRREVLDMDIGVSEAATFWIELLRKLTRRGLRGVKVVICDAHEGIHRPAVSRVLSCNWQRCRVHFMRNALTHACKTQRAVVSALVGTAFAQDDPISAWRFVINDPDRIRSIGTRQ